VLASARRIRWSICAPHAGQFDVGVTLFLEVPFRQLWCITSLSRKKVAALSQAIAAGGERIEAVEATVQLKRRTKLPR
jgi:hypothetical protein